jgi:hypothetical protein
MGTMTVRSIPSWLMRLIFAIGLLFGNAMPTASDNAQDLNPGLEELHRSGWYAVYNLDFGAEPFYWIACLSKKANRRCMVRKLSR